MQKHEVKFNMSDGSMKFISGHCDHADSLSVERIITKNNDFISNKSTRILHKGESLKKKESERRRIDLKKFSKIIQSIISNDDEFNISKKTVIEKNLNCSSFALINIKSKIKIFDKSSSKNIEKSINHTKNFELDSTNSSNMMKLIFQQRKNRKNKQK